MKSKCQLRTDDERWRWQLYFVSKLTIVSLLCHTMVLYLLKRVIIKIIDKVRTTLFWNNYYQVRSNNQIFRDWLRPSAFFNIINIVHMTFSLPRRINILCKITALFIITLFSPGYEYVRVDILLTCRKHLHDRIISLRGEVWYLTLELFPLRGIFVFVQGHSRTSILNETRTIKQSVKP